MLDFYNVIDLVKQTGQVGLELLGDSFILGVAFGRGQIETLSEIQNAVNKLYSLKQSIDNSQASPFVRDDYFGKYLANKNHQLFADCQLKNYAVLKPKVEIQPQNQCILCGFMFTNNQSEICQLSDCKHRFHIKCLYVYTQKYKNDCPSCKKPQFKELPDLLFDSLDYQYKSCCPTFGCDQQFLFYGQQMYSCKKCYKNYCLICKREAHYQQKCQLDVGHFQMRMGEKFKYCSICKNSIFQYSDFIMNHECEQSEQKERKRDKIFKIFKQTFDIHKPF